MHRGKLIILLMVIAGCATGALSVAYHHWLARRAIAWWGSDNVELIVRAPRVEALKLSRTTQSDLGETLTIGGVRYHVDQRKDVTGVQGMDHLRHGLLEDADFTWDAPRQPNSPPQWSFGLQFIDGLRRLAVVFDRDRQIGRSDATETLLIAPIATGWREFFVEQFPAEAKLPP